MKDRQPLVHRAMFNPGAEGQLRFSGLMQILGGGPYRELVAGIEHGAFDRFSIPGDLSERLNGHFYNALADHLSLPDGVNRDRFWKNQQRAALGVHFKLAETFRSLNLDILCEVTKPQSGISDAVATLTQEGHGSMQGHERKRVMLLGLVSAAIQADNIAIDLDTEMLRVDHVLIKHFWANKDNTRSYRIYSYHDKTTNRVVGPKADPETGDLILPHNVVEKSFCRRVRDVKGDGPVYYDSNVKPDVSGMMKAVDRAARNNGYVRPEKDVQDRFRFVMVRMAPRTTAEQMDQMLQAVLNEHYRPITNVEPDHATDGYKNGNLEWHRVKYHFGDFPTPLEAVFYDVGGYLNYLYEVGVRNPRTGYYSGISRDLYETLRMGRMLEVGHPKELYGLDPQKAVADRMEELVPGIRRAGLPKEVKKEKIA